MGRTRGSSSTSEYSKAEAGLACRLNLPSNRHANRRFAPVGTPLMPNVGRRLRSWRWLLSHAWRDIIDAGPRWRARCPDGHRGLRELRIVERSNPNEDQMRSSLGLAEQWSATARAEAAVHPIAAVRHTRVVARRARDLEGRGAKARAHRSAAGAQVLAVAAPAHARGDRGFIALPTNRTAKATACQCHVALQGRSRAGPQIGILESRSNSRRSSCRSNLI